MPVTQRERRKKVFYAGNGAYRLIFGGFGEGL